MLAGLVRAYTKQVMILSWMCVVCSAGAMNSRQQKQLTLDERFALMSLSSGQLAERAVNDFLPMTGGLQGTQQELKDAQSVFLSEGNVFRQVDKKDENVQTALGILRHFSGLGNQTAQNLIANLFKCGVALPQSKVLAGALFAESGRPIGTILQDSRQVNVRELVAELVAARQDGGGDDVLLQQAAAAPQPAAEVIASALVASQDGDGGARPALKKKKKKKVSTFQVDAVVQEGSADDSHDEHASCAASESDAPPVAQALEQEQQKKDDKKKPKLSYAAAVAGAVAAPKPQPTVADVAAEKKEEDESQVAGEPKGGKKVDKGSPKGGRRYANRGGRGLNRCSRAGHTKYSGRRVAPQRGGRGRQKSGGRASRTPQLPQRKTQPQAAPPAPPVPARKMQLKSAPTLVPAQPVLTPQPEIKRKDKEEEDVDPRFARLESFHAAEAYEFVEFALEQLKTGEGNTVVSDVQRRLKQLMQPQKQAKKGKKKKKKKGKEQKPQDASTLHLYHARLALAQGNTAQAFADLAQAGLRAENLQDEETKKRLLIQVRETGVLDALRAVQEDVTDADSLRKMAQLHIWAGDVGVDTQSPLLGSAYAERKEAIRLLEASREHSTLSEEESQIKHALSVLLFMQADTHIKVDMSAEDKRLAEDFATRALELYPTSIDPRLTLNNLAYSAMCDENAVESMRLSNMLAQGLGAIQPQTSIDARKKSFLVGVHNIRAALVNALPRSGDDTEPRDPAVVKAHLRRAVVELMTSSFETLKHKVGGNIADMYAKYLRSFMDTDPEIKALGSYVLAAMYSGAAAQVSDDMGAEERERLEAEQRLYEEGMAALREAQDPTGRMCLAARQLYSKDEFNDGAQLAVNLFLAVPNGPESYSQRELADALMQCIAQTGREESSVWLADAFNSGDVARIDRVLTAEVEGLGQLQRLGRTYSKIEKAGYHALVLEDAGVCAALQLRAQADPNVSRILGQKQVEYGVHELRQANTMIEGGEKQALIKKAHARIQEGLQNRLKGGEDTALVGKMCNGVGNDVCGLDNLSGQEVDIALRIWQQGADLGNLCAEFQLITMAGDTPEDKEVRLRSVISRALKTGKHVVVQSAHVSLVSVLLKQDKYEKAEQAARKAGKLEKECLDKVAKNTAQHANQLFLVGNHLAALERMLQAQRLGGVGADQAVESILKMIVSGVAALEEAGDVQMALEYARVAHEHGKIKQKEVQRLNKEWKAELRKRAKATRSGRQPQTLTKAQQKKQRREARRAQEKETEVDNRSVRAQLDAQKAATLSVQERAKKEKRLKAQEGLVGILSHDDPRYSQFLQDLVAGHQELGNEDKVVQLRKMCTVRAQELNEQLGNSALDIWEQTRLLRQCADMHLAAEDIEAAMDVLLGLKDLSLDGEGGLDALLAKHNIDEEAARGIMQDDVACGNKLVALVQKKYKGDDAKIMELFGPIMQSGADIASNMSVHVGPDGNVDMQVSEKPGVTLAMPDGTTHDLGSVADVMHIMAQFGGAGSADLPDDQMEDTDLLAALADQARGEQGVQQDVVVAGQRLLAALQAGRILQDGGLPKPLFQHYSRVLCAVARKAEKDTEAQGLCDEIVAAAAERGLTCRPVVYQTPAVRDYDETIGKELLKLRERDLNTFKTARTHALGALQNGTVSTLAKNTLRMLVDETPEIAKRSAYLYGKACVWLAIFDPACRNELIKRVAEHSEEPYVLPALAQTLEVLQGQERALRNALSVKKQEKKKARKKLQKKKTTQDVVDAIIAKEKHLSSMYHELQNTIASVQGVFASKGFDVAEYERLKAVQVSDAMHEHKDALDTYAPLVACEVRINEILGFLNDANFVGATDAAIELLRRPEFVYNGRHMNNSAMSRFNQEFVYAFARVVNTPPEMAGLTESQHALAREQFGRLFAAAGEVGAHISLVMLEKNADKVDDADDQ